MSSPLKGNKLYPDIPTPTSSLLLTPGIKRKGGEGVVEKENEEVEEIIHTKKIKLSSNIDDSIASLKQEIEKEVLIRDAANKFVGLAKNQKQSMEASKGLFVSNMKILELMKKQQHLRDSVGEPANKGSQQLKGDIEPCQARIGISDIRIPLEWKEFEQVKGKIDSSSKYGVFCLFRLGSQVMDTRALVVVDRSTMDISFPDTIVFPKLVDPDFTIQVEVYCSVPTEQHPPSATPSGTSSTGKTSTPIKMLRKIKKDHLPSSSPMTPSASMVSLSPYVPRMQSATPTHTFSLAAHTQFTLKNVTGECNTYTLTVGAIGASGIAVTSSQSG